MIKNTFTTKTPPLRLPFFISYRRVLVMRAVFHSALSWWLCFFLFSPFLGWEVGEVGEVGEVR